jgi:hypothetical protein
MTNKQHHQIDSPMFRVVNAGIRQGGEVLSNVAFLATNTAAQFARVLASGAIGTISGVLKKKTK